MVRLTAYLLFGVFLLKLLHPALGIHDLLLSRVKGMALGADVEMYFFPGRSCSKGLAAGTAHLNFLIFRMNSFLQFRPPEIRC